MNKSYIMANFYENFVTSFSEERLIIVLKEKLRDMDRSEVEDYLDEHEIYVLNHDEPDASFRKLGIDEIVKFKVSILL